MDYFSIRLWCVKKTGFYMTTSSVVRSRKSSIALPKAKLAPKKGSWSLFGGLLPSDPLQLPESQQKHLWEVCSENQWDASKTTKLQPALVNRKAPILLHNNALPQPTLQKLNKLGYEVLPHPPYSADLSLTKYHFFQDLSNFLQGKCFHKQQDSENAFQESVESRRTDFYVMGINKHFWLSRTCWL